MFNVTYFWLMFIQFSFFIFINSKQMDSIFFSPILYYKGFQIKAVLNFPFFILEFDDNNWLSKVSKHNSSLSEPNLSLKIGIGHLAIMVISFFCLLLTLNLLVLSFFSTNLYQCDKWKITGLNSIILKKFFKVRIEFCLLWFWHTINFFKDRWEASNQFYFVGNKIFVVLLY